jgi:hypothetical protein
LHEGVGSNWARGTSGVGVEFHGYYDNTYFKSTEVNQIDYCSATGFGPQVEDDADWCTATR